MVKGTVDWHEWGLATIMLLVGAGFVVLGFAGNPALLLTGLFYAVIGLRGLLAIRKKRKTESSPPVEPPLTDQPVGSVK